MPLPSLTHEPGTSESSFHLKRKIGILCILKINGLSIFNLVYTHVGCSFFILLFCFSNPFDRVKFLLFQSDGQFFFDKILCVDLLLIQKGQI